MSTPLKTIYDSCLGKLEKEDAIVNLTEDLYLEEMFVLFKSARSEFVTVKKDLETITEVEEVKNPGAGDEYTNIVRTLDADLGENEIDILAFLMVVAILERKSTNSEFYEALGLTTKDFKQFSQANQLNAIDKKVESHKKRAKIKMRLYDRIKNDKGTVTTFIDEMGDL
jgi:hypothetical protein